MNNLQSACELKPLSNRILKTRKLPDLLYVNKGLFIEPVNYKIIDASDSLSLLFSGDDTVFLKVMTHRKEEEYVFILRENGPPKKV